jgi:glutamine cyclotransferase
MKTFPHNTKAFTEGLLIHNNKLLESTGLNNQSWIAEVNLLTGEHDKKVTLPEQYFGEGIAVLNGRLFQLTYQEKVGFIYDAETYDRIGEFQYTTEGWGLTNNGTHLIMSDGTHKLYFLDTTALKPVRTLSVTDPSGAKVSNLNELEFINGFIYANVYETSTIVKINPATGLIAGRLDLSALVNETKRLYPDASELNGIAFDPNENTLLVTGKFWPKAYVVRIY